MTMLSLTLKSMRNRRFTLGLTLLSVAISVMLLLGVERLQSQLKQSFTQTISGTDIIVGPRTSQVNLLLYTVFGIGEPTNSLSLAAWQHIKSMPGVSWTVPLSFGDSHQGYRVVGTNQEYFARRLYANKQALIFQQGKPFEDEHQVVLGAQVANALGYQLGQQLVLSHGVSKVSFSKHGNHPLSVAGILAPTGTPIDQRIFVPLAALDEMHAPMRDPHNPLNHDDISALYLGVEAPQDVLRILRAINEFDAEPMTALLPLMTMQQVWRLMDSVQLGLLLLAAIVVASTLLTLLTNMLTSLSQRQREMAVLRALGAAPRHIFSLLLAESLLVGVLGIVLGLAALYGLQYAGAPYLQAVSGLRLSPDWPQPQEITLLAMVLGCAMLVSLVPAWRAYRMTVHDGMQMRG
ncbi:ABC transporter permease [Bowmanella sp. JS7-9]|uniref:ABC transporter permease n=1 Tax=Pseudobowmanella zhangzhouensis TaxID=1537679 RepID=A0ABW1XNB2_9ALTE|nr:ABC transporter permease [Bowmanella sp. JS7-9]TBX19936.1 hypothetical protein TK45_15800 [Bowmanella sp. JS7-9]